MTTFQFLQHIRPLALGLLATSCALGHKGAFSDLPPLVFACREGNDLLAVARAAGLPVQRCDTVAEAIETAPNGGGVLLLADGYPDARTPADAALLEKAATKGLRVYVEFPAMLPGLETGGAAYVGTGPYNAVVERTVLTSEAFRPALEPMRIVMIHDCHYVPVDVPAALTHMQLARVEGYDHAVYGLPEVSHPILFEIPESRLLVATTKLSQFVTGRYAPTEAWGPIMRMVLSWAAGRDLAELELTWTPTVRPSYGATEPLPGKALADAIRRGVTYYDRSRLYVHADWPGDSTGVDPIPPDWPVGDGSLGIGECYISKRTFTDGSQAVSRNVRADCNLEAAMGLAVGARAFGLEEAGRIAERLSDYVFFESNLCQGPRADLESPSYGLIGGSVQTPWIYWGDDNARALLSAFATAGLLGEGRWNESMVRAILANFRTSGVYGFRPVNLTEDALQANGWRRHFESDHVDYCPHMECWPWATFLRLYAATGYEPLIEKSRTGLRMMMEAHPKWRLEANRQETERCRMLLPLAWLVRVDDTPEHRRWLREMVDYVIDLQDPCGAIPQVPGHVVDSNAGYGAGECAIVHETGDPATDSLYALNFAFIGMHEAAMATGDSRMADSARRMADFYIRTQTLSETHPELDGTWYRGFDYRKWDYWASDGDAGWGVWTNEIGWTHSWITLTLALRALDTSLWEITSDVDLRAPFPALRKQMLPE